MNKLKKVAAGVCAATLLSYGSTASAAITAAPGAVADAYLLIDNFALRLGNGAAGVGGLIDITGGNIIIDSAITTAEADSALNGVSGPAATDSVGIGVPINVSSTVGVGYVAETLLTGDPVAQYAGSSSSSVGNALLATDRVPVHSQVSLNSFGSIGSASSNQDLTVEFQVTSQIDQLFEMSFEADGFLRAALAQDGINATANYNWKTTVIDLDTGLSILEWTPNGATFIGSGDCVDNGYCTEYADAYSLNSQRATNSENDFVLDQAVGLFEIELLLTAGVNYGFTIQHATNVNAETPIPEPATTALLGLGLVGMGAIRRKRNKSI